MMNRAFSILTVLLALAVAWPAPCRADETSREYQLKAAFIYNFLPFIEWPADAFDGDKAPFVVAVVGSDPFKGSLDATLKDKTVGGRPVVLKRFDSLAAVGKCHLLFVENAEAAQLPAALERLNERHTLTVGESSDFTRLKGAVRFYKEDNKIRFEINTAAAERARLKVSAKLLKLAKVVEE